MVARAKAVASGVDPGKLPTQTSSSASEPSEKDSTNARNKEDRDRPTTLSSSDSDSARRLFSRDSVEGDDTVGTTELLQRRSSSQKYGSNLLTISTDDQEELPSAISTNIVNKPMRTDAESLVVVNATTVS